MSLLPPFASYWLAAAESGFAQREAWAGWADTCIAHMESPPSWIIDLSLAGSRDDVWKLLAQQIDQEEKQGFTRVEIYEAVLGYLWLRLERGEIDLRTCLELAGRHADAYETSVECETFFALLNQFTAGENVYCSAKTLFMPFRNLAAQQWAILSSCRPLTRLPDT